MLLSSVGRSRVREALEGTGHDVVQVATRLLVWTEWEPSSRRAERLETERVVAAVTEDLAHGLSAAVRRASVEPTRLRPMGFPHGALHVVQRHQVPHNGYSSLGNRVLPPRAVLTATELAVVFHRARDYCAHSVPP